MALEHRLKKLESQFNKGTYAGCQLIQQIAYKDIPTRYLCKWPNGKIEDITGDEKAIKELQAEDCEKIDIEIIETDWHI